MKVFFMIFKITIERKKNYTLSCCHFLFMIKTDPKFDTGSILYVKILNLKNNHFY